MQKEKGKTHAHTALGPPNVAAAAAFCVAERMSNRAPSLPALAKPKSHMLCKAALCFRLQLLLGPPWRTFGKTTRHRDSFLWRSPSNKEPCLLGLQQETMEYV